jgi:hypothetical protein
VPSTHFFFLLISFTQCLSMAGGLKTWRIILLSILLALSNWEHRACGSSPQVPCLFMFGDSLFDNGNNMVLVTDVKASYLPYGVDFPYGSTGRCSNGLNLADVIGLQLPLSSLIIKHKIFVWFLFTICCSFFHHLILRNKDPV